MRINPDVWTPIAKKLIWRCCKCGKIHKVQFKVSKNEIFIKEWKIKSRSGRGDCHTSGLKRTQK